MPAKSEKMKSLGLCLGASTISVAVVEADRNAANAEPRLVSFSRHAHGGDIRQVLTDVIGSLAPGSFDRIAATGRKFRHIVNLSSIAEPEAVEIAYSFVKPENISCPAIVSAGGETFMVYLLSPAGKISKVLTGNKCASGTGEFFMQQLRRMNVSLEEASKWASGETPHRVSGRCSVFCKSDCTHATNKGVPKSKVVAGLCRMMAEKILELLRKTEKQNIMITGGASQNHMMTAHLKRKIPGLIVPEEACVFEALGAALWAFENSTAPFPPEQALFRQNAESFNRLPGLKGFESDVTFKTCNRGEIRAGDTCILGLDVGSTTTKAVLIRKNDDTILASIYLRTDGDPVAASRKCYSAILKQVMEKTEPENIAIEALGVCGSGRQIAGLHALTGCVVNEIIAHAEASVHFDAGVDTIFEIGGQDAKYTHITGGVPSDYAMNEACSAGTGSFLEESAYETLGIPMEDIGAAAMKGDHPPNFNDQCAAFIASDIKNAIHSDISQEDIVAGLVYSICMNYKNRVMGNRPIGEKIFMQGGVCYNRAVPLAMASLTGKPVIVPPEPGLMGAFGVALAAKKRIAAGLLEKNAFDLETLIKREVRYHKPFICGGGRQKCDRKCDIAVIEVDGSRYPFGGACNRYYNLRNRISCRTEDLVSLRQKLVFETYGKTTPPERYKTPRGNIGISRSFLVNSYFPLFSTFFTQLGFDIVLPDSASQKGMDMREAPFCYPGELAHGFFLSLADKKPDYIFLPHFKGVPAQKAGKSSVLCPFVQGEPFYLKSTFSDEIQSLEQSGTTLLTPLINLVTGLEAAKKPLVDCACDMGVSKKEAHAAFKKAAENQNRFQAEMKRHGKMAMEELEASPDKMAAVIFGRPYNGFAGEANMGIPHKMASRGITVIPFDFLPFEDEPLKSHMYWGMGQMILQAAETVKRHPQLFGTYITNFSCGPDSFLTGYFRNIMGRKPSLTLELDSHTADAGLETRIEAFLDIAAAYRRIPGTEKNKPGTFSPARTSTHKGSPVVINSSGEIIPITSPDVTFAIPSMGRFASEALASILSGKGFKTVALPPPDEETLKTGRAHTSCKECLPLILTTGSLLNYITNRKREGETVVYFMPSASGPCRFGQYNIFMKDLIEHMKLRDVAIFSLSSENGYTGLDGDYNRYAWWGVVISDVMEDIRSVILANAENTALALEVLENEWRLIRKSLEAGDTSKIEKQIKKCAERLGEIPVKRDIGELPVILLTGEIFVRRDHLSRQLLTEKLAERGFSVICSHIGEWILYTEYLVQKNLSEVRTSTAEKAKSLIRTRFMRRIEKRIKSIFMQSGLLNTVNSDIDKIIRNASPYISPALTGEAILTIGASIEEIASPACGVIAIGPFGCMPNRIAESILSRLMNKRTKISSGNDSAILYETLKEIDSLPFLTIESDGSPFPQLLDAKLDAFCLQAARLHNRMIGVRRSN